MVYRIAKFWEIYNSPCYWEEKDSGLIRTINDSSFLEHHWMGLVGGLLLLICWVEMIWETFSDIYKFSYTGDKILLAAFCAFSLHRTHYSHGGYSGLELHCKPKKPLKRCTHTYLSHHFCFVISFFLSSCF